ncbi:hypothetical protein CJD36_008130 [Flavipsychrobacter stenotrophus]|uniref:Uncharacterized protein n=1 Tax=Flavipsychrobacter stenotrophus TaxID=2077091 RepID=A0A2S7SXU6_9BACT|nr:hypothetical protein CJD36_008130 [Flavipsychrobacter stenotrophus]
MFVLNLSLWKVFATAIIMFISTYANAQITSFNCERKKKNRAPIPKTILAILQKVEQINVSDRYGFSDKEVNGFASAEGAFVTLQQNGAKAMIVQGVDGADNVGVWLFEEQHGQWKLIFHDRGLKITLMKMPVHGHRKVVFSACWANGCHERSYKYINGTYQQYSCTEITDAGRKPCK